MDWADYVDKRDEFIAKYERTVLVAHVSQPNGELALWGPFYGGEEALAWMTRCVPSSVWVTFVPLRHKEHKGEKSDFYIPSRFLKKDDFATVSHPLTTVVANETGGNQ